MTEPTAPVAFRALLRIAEDSPKSLGRILYRIDETGHSALCRLLSAVAHYGPHGTFVCTHCAKLDTGGYMCSFGVQCGEPTESHMQHMNEIHEQFLRVTKILEANGSLLSMVWENPRFSSEGLCNCGKPDEKRLTLHDPLCNYRVKHGIEVTIAEYRAALGRPV